VNFTLELLNRDRWLSSQTHEPVYRYLRQSDGNSSNKLTLKPKACSDPDGLKRCFIEHFKSYVVVFVSLKSVGK
jgi:hypothetical protein